ncbi:MAG TPA: hypothetical protein EYP99_00905 [Candidatus Poseidoniales archaeon]|nr:hypothetical protein [Candidatus Poseidoniales archaeon]
MQRATLGDLDGSVEDAILTSSMVVSFWPAGSTGLWSRHGAAETDLDLGFDEVEARSTVVSVLGKTGDDLDESVLKSIVGGRSRLRASEVDRDDWSVITSTAGGEADGPASNVTMWSSTIC